MFGRKETSKLIDYSEEETEASCVELGQLFGDLTMEEQAIYLKLFSSTVGAITHLVEGRAEEIPLSGGWSMQTKDGIIYMDNDTNAPIALHNLFELDNCSDGEYSYAGCTIEIMAGIDERAVLVKNKDSIAVLFTVSLADKISDDVEDAIRRLSK